MCDESKPLLAADLQYQSLVPEVCNETLRLALRVLEIPQPFSVQGLSHTEAQPSSVPIEAELGPASSAPLSASLPEGVLSVKLQAGRQFVAFNPAIIELPTTSRYAENDGEDGDEEGNGDKGRDGDADADADGVQGGGGGGDEGKQGVRGNEETFGAIVECSGHATECVGDSDATWPMLEAGREGAGREGAGREGAPVPMSDGDEGVQYIVFFRYSDVRSMWSMAKEKPWQRSFDWRVRLATSSGLCSQLYCTPPLRCHLNYLHSYSEYAYYCPASTVSGPVLIPRLGGEGLGQD